MNPTYQPGTLMPLIPENKPPRKKGKAGLIIGLVLGFLLLCGLVIGAGIVLSKSQLPALPNLFATRTPGPTSTPVPTLTPTPGPVEPGVWDATIVIPMGDQVNMVILAFTVAPDGAQITDCNSFDLATSTISFFGSYDIVNGKFSANWSSYVGNTNVTYILDGTFTASNKVVGIYNFSYGYLGNFTGDWEGAPKAP